ncbi:momilactone A synthase-like [Musa acuminata AAA Group]|uniref:momilactone A synthase-like n=1 Tax=Musa acuminata AAA Group TaxID=214697 RepID=UPI0031DAB2AE
MEHLDLERGNLQAMASVLVGSSIARRLEGKVAVITGGASGIGECTVKLFVRHGARVVVADIKDEKGRSLCAALGLDVASYVHCDVTSEADVKNAVDTAVSLHGKLDIMFNNAGVALGRDHGFLNGEHSASLFERMMAVNVLGVYLGTKHAARVMAPARSGCIVTTASSVSALGGMAPAFYTCSKYAVVGLMRSAAAELGKFGVRANCVSPHLLATPMTSAALGMTDEEVERLLDAGANLKGVTAKPEDIAEAVLYLASDESRYVSGHNLFVDGGFTVTKSM